MAVLQPEALACALFLMAAFTLAGLAQTAWFSAPVSWQFALPLDGGRRFRGQPIFGAHKTLRGFVIMLPATAVAFLVLAAAVEDPGHAGLWQLSWPGYAALGGWAACGFMAGELPNSFVKRQLGIAPGAASRSAFGRTTQFVADRLDSGIGMLAFISMAVTVPATTWLIVLSLGPFVHWSFSVLMFRLGLKARPA